MSYQPVVPVGGYAGWMFLNRTLEAQKSVHAESVVQKRAVDYFVEKIGQVTTADELVNDRQLLTVALGAFGLDADINNRFFIKKVLEEGTTDDKALANRLADKSYKALSEAFGFGTGQLPRTGLAGFAKGIVAAFEDRQFEIAVGEQDTDMRLALTAQRELAEIASNGSSEDTKWYRIMGSEPLRAVMETTLGLPKSFGQLGLDQQLGIFKQKAEKVFGAPSVSQFGAPEKMDDLVRTFLLRSEIANGQQAMSSGSIALTLLGAATPSV